MKKLEFPNGIYTVLRPLYYVCKVFGLASYSYVADRRNKRITTNYGYSNYMFTVIWLIVYIFGMAVHILELRRDDVDSKVLFFVKMLYSILLYTSSTVVVVWVSIIRREKFLEIIENISAVDNKLRFTLQEEKYMNRNVMFNIISEIILLTVIECVWIIIGIYNTASEPHYIIALATISNVPDICNALIVFQFINLVFMMKQRNRQLNKRLTTWINGTVSRPIYLNNGNDRHRQFDRTDDHVNIIPVFVSSVGNTEGILRQTDIHLLRQIYSELYDITCLINDTYGIPILVIVCSMLTGVVLFLYQGLIYLDKWSGQNVTYGITFMLLFFKVTLFCHTATNEARSSSIIVEKLLLKGNCRKECVEELKMFSLQLQVMTNEYTACGFFSLNLRLFTSVVSVIVSYFVIMVQVK